MTFDYKTNYSAIALAFMDIAYHRYLAYVFKKLHFVAMLAILALVRFKIKGSVAYRIVDPIASKYSPIRSNVVV